MRALVDLARLQVLRDSLLRRTEAATLRWGDVKVHADGSGRLHVVRSKTDHTAEGVVLYWGQAAVEALPAIRPEEAVIDPGASVFGLSANQISRRIKAAAKMAGLGEGFSAHSPRVGMDQDLSAAGAELPELMTEGVGTAPPKLDKIKNLHTKDTIATEDSGTRGRSMWTPAGETGRIDKWLFHIRPELLGRAFSGGPGMPQRPAGPLL